MVESPWPGYAQQKNLAAEHAANDWILSIDADEALSEALEGEIWQIKKNGASYDAYTVPRLAQYMGRWILHSGWYPDRKIRLYHRRKALWVGDFVHESVKVDGSSGIWSPIYCISRAILSPSISRRWIVILRSPPSRSSPKASKSARSNCCWIPRGPSQYVFLQRGFQDGLEGLTIAYMAALYNFVKYAKARNMAPRR